MVGASRRFADPVHGTIVLSSEFAEVVDARVFQMLRHVLQLGLAHYVYPGANYTRLSHSLGTHHVITASLAGLRENGFEFTDAETFALAGLVHDIGHYPFSHAMEDALKEFHADRLMVDAEDPNPDEEAPDNYLGHVDVGRQILLEDDEIASALPSWADAKAVADAFSRRGDSPLINLISSDLDADRIDFLLRTAHHTGLPYGRVDLDYLLSHLRLEDGKRLVLHHKALRTADHMLLCRFFDYQQVVFQKTVAGLEEVLKAVLIDLIKLNLLPSSVDSVIAMIRSGEWRSFDDAEALGLIRAFSKEATDPVEKTRAVALVDRTPPRLVFEMDFMAPRESGSLRLSELRGKLNELKEALSSRSGIDPRLWWVWGKKAELTSAGPTPAGEDPEELDPSEYAKAVRVLELSGSPSAAITDLEASLMSVLGGQWLFGLKLFVLATKAQRAEVERMRAEVTEAMEGTNLSQPLASVEHETRDLQTDAQRTPSKTPRRSADAV